MVPRSSMLVFTVLETQSEHDFYAHKHAVDGMRELTVGAGKFTRLLDYIEQIGLDPSAVASRVNIVPARVVSLPSGQQLPALQYARLYKEAVVEMQTPLENLVDRVGLVELFSGVGGARQAGDGLL